MIRTDVSDGVAVVTLNRPERRNALNGALISALRSTMSAVDADGAVSVIVLTGADPAFCAGIDIKELSRDREAASRQFSCLPRRANRAGRGPVRPSR